jgi:hypothetical protein
LLAVALIVVPETVTVAPSPLGQAAGVGRTILCAPLQSSLAGCVKTTILENKKESSMNDLIKLQQVLSYKPLDDL